jgi:hypothetical protein
MNEARPVYKVVWEESKVGFMVSNITIEASSKGTIINSIKFLK